MPYSKRNSRRRFRRSRFRGFSGSKREVIYKRVPRLTTLNQKIKKINSSVETKYEDTLFSNTVADTPSVILLNGTTQGTGQSSNRVASKINSTSIQFRAHLATDSDLLESTRFRMIIFWDRQPNGVLPTIVGNPSSGTDCLLNTSTVTDPILAPYSMEHNMRFQPIYDKVITINPMTGQGTMGDAVVSVSAQWRKKIKLSRIVKYDGNGNGIADLVSNSLICTVMSDQASEVPQFDCGFRFNYKDA